MIKKSHKPERDTSRFVLHCAKQLWCWHSSVGALGFYCTRFYGGFSKENNSCAVLQPNLDGFKSLGL